MSLLLGRRGYRGSARAPKPRANGLVEDVPSQPHRDLPGRVGRHRGTGATSYARFASTKPMTLRIAGIHRSSKSNVAAGFEHKIHIREIDQGVVEQVRSVNERQVEPLAGGQQPGQRLVVSGPRGR